MTLSNIVRLKRLNIRNVEMKYELILRLRNYHLQNRCVHHILITFTFSSTQICENKNQTHLHYSMKYLREKNTGFLYIEIPKYTGFPELLFFNNGTTFPKNIIVFYQLGSR